MYYTLDGPKKVAEQQESTVARQGPTGALDVFEQLQEEIKLSEYLARREKERRQKKRELPRIVPAAKATKQASRRAKSTPPMRWLQNLICSLVHGELTPDGVRPSVNIKGLIGRWNLDLQMRKLANYRMEDHFQGLATYYFFGNGNHKDEFTLAMIDIDVLKSLGLGSPEGALAFAEHLRRSRFPGLYFERSTGGKGIHAYVLVRKLGDSAKSVNAGLRRLQNWLRAEAKRVNADIELVEIKGTCPEITFNHGMMESVKYGFFAKLPRESQRFDEWQATTVLRLDELQAAQYDVKAKAEVVASPSPAITGTAKKLKPKKQMVRGSVTGKFITDEELACIPKYEALYRQITGGKNLKARKFAVTAHDFAVAMVLLRYFKKKPNVDGSLPGDRVEELWTGLYSAEDVQRPWNHHRWKAIRDFLSKEGHIHWIDNRYEYGQKVNGKFVPGVACKFSITDEFADNLDMVATVTTSSTGGASLMDTAVAPCVPPKGKGLYLIPKLFPVRAEKERLFWKMAYEASETLCAA